MMKRLAGLTGLACVLLLSAAAQPALAQSGVCQSLGPLMQERERLMNRVNALGRRVDPAQACQLFGQLANNGARTLAFVRENKDWCQIPDEFATNLANAQSQVTRVRGQACTAARQQAQMQAQARQQARQTQENLGAFGGADTVTGGAWRIPQGAL